MCLHKSQSLDRQAALLKDLADVVILQRCACFALNGIDGVVVAGIGAVFGDVYQRLVRCVASVRSHISTVCSGVTIAVIAQIPTRFDDEVTVSSFTSFHSTQLHCH